MARSGMALLPRPCFGRAPAAISASISAHKSQHVAYRLYTDSLYLLTPSSQKFLKYISCGEISRNTASCIFQLQVGHSPLNAYLHRFQRVDSPRCPDFGHPKETTEHFLLQCQSYAHERWMILNKTSRTLAKLLRLLTSPKLLISLANFMEATGRFAPTDASNQVSNG